MRTRTPSINPKARTLGSLILTAGVVVFGLAVAQLLRLKTPGTERRISAPGYFAQDPGPGTWAPVPGLKLPTITAFSFSSPLSGAAVSADGALEITDDGGSSWSPIPGPRIREGEIPSAVVIEPGAARIVIATHVDESNYTGRYIRSAGGSWDYRYAPLGGVVAGDGAYIVGGAGLIGVYAHSSLSFSQIPNSYSIPYYSVAHFADTVIAGASDGLYALSVDAGSAWDLHRLPSVSSSGYAQQLTAVALGERTALIGGLNGALWRSDSQGREWAIVRGLASSQMVTALCLAPTGDEAIIGGGNPEGNGPFLASSADTGRTWQFEPLRAASGRILAVSHSAEGFFAATSDGYILRRQ